MLPSAEPSHSVEANRRLRPLRRDLAIALPQPRDHPIQNPPPFVGITVSHSYRCLWIPHGHLRPLVHDRFAVCA